MRFVAGLALALAQAASLTPAAAPAQAAQEPFVVAGITYAEASDFLRRLQLSVGAGDARGVAALTLFPLTVRGKAGPKTASELAQRFYEIYTEKVRTAVLTQRVDGFFANSRGLMIGNGEVWISALCDADSAPGACKNHRVLIVSVNN